MAIAQDVYDIPADMATKLATGEYRRIGSVIRYAMGPNKGQIVKHLKPIELETVEQAKGVAANAVQFFNQHKKGVVVAIAGTAVLSGAAWIYNKVHSREPKAVTEFRAALKTYIEAIRSGTMELGSISRLMASLDNLKCHKDYEKISIQLTTEELEVLVGRIYEYTVKLAADNSIELTAADLQMSDAGSHSAIVDLQTYLKAQKKILEAVA